MSFTSISPSFKHSILQCCAIYTLYPSIRRFSLISLVRICGVNRDRSLFFQPLLVAQLLSPICSQYVSSFRTYSPLVNACIWICKICNVFSSISLSFLWTQNKGHTLRLLITTRGVSFIDLYIQQELQLPSESQLYSVMYQYLLLHNTPYTKCAVPIFI